MNVPSSVLRVAVACLPIVVLAGLPVLDRTRADEGGETSSASASRHPQNAPQAETNREHERRNRAADNRADDPQSLGGDDEVPSGFRRLSVDRFGVHVLRPQGWQVIAMDREEQAFVLKLPGDHAGEPSAIVACEIGIAPSALDEYKKRIVARAEQQPNQNRELLSTEILLSDAGDEPAQKPDGGKPQFDILETIWTFERPGLGVWYDVKRYVIRNGHLYTFTLHVDQGHYEAYRLDFRRMVEAARFSDIQTGMEQNDAGYWVQQEFAFGMKLPEQWRPAFRVTDEVLYFAIGASKEVFTNNLVVTGQRPGQIAFEQLKERLIEQIPQARAGAKVIRCEVVEAGDQEMLETVIELKQGPFEFVIFERRVQGERLNYEIRFTVLKEQFEELEPALKKSADSFREFPVTGRKEVI